ncbi:hypothetical protein JCM3770_003118 [Rhodotorula araucariae]
MASTRPHAPAVSSRLASSSSPARHPSSDSQLPSSPTTSAFYRPTRSRVYKPTTSSRSPAFPNSLRAAQDNARRQRAHHRHLEPGEGGPDGPGGWGSDGEWQEWDDDDLRRLEAELRKDRRRWEWDLRLREEQARDDGILVDPDLDLDLDLDERDDGLLAQEPPLDILYADDALPSPALYPPHTRRLPSLASAPASSASSVGALSEPEPDGDSGMDLDGAHGDDLAAFAAALRTAPCPACAASAPGGSLTLTDAEGLRCGACGWGIPPSVMAPLAGAFVSHGRSAEGHAPLLSWTQFTGTIVLCAAGGGVCDEQFAA